VEAEKITAMPFISERAVPNRWAGAFCLLILAGVTVWLFWPFFRWLAGTWRALYQDTFGYLVPLISVWAVLRERQKILNAPAGCSRRGWAFFLPGLLLALFSREWGHAVGACLSFPLYCYGLCLLVWGNARARHLVFPIFICLFLYPWDTLVESLVGFHLRLLSSWMAYGGLKIMGLGVSISGTLIETKRFSIDVVPACSGLTTLKILFFSGAIGAYLYQGSKWRKGSLWASTVPLAVILNTLRIVSVGLAGHFFGQAVAVSFFHGVSGLLCFGAGLLLLYGEAALLKRY
jgi:exosortase